VPSFDCARPFAAMVNYGNASGDVPPFNLMLLAQKGRLALHRPRSANASGVGVELLDHQAL
jgi:NADPH2:quinone reductase